MSEVTRASDSTARQAYIAEHYPKKTAKPGKGVFVCKRCGLVNNSKNPMFRSSFIQDQWVATLGSLMSLEAQDDKRRGPATNDDLRGWKATEEEANFCMFEDSYPRRKTGETREVWVEKHHQVEQFGKYNARTGKWSKRKVWVGGYVTETDPVEPYIFYDPAGGHDQKYNTHRKWVKLQMEPEQDVVLKMSMYANAGDTLQSATLKLFELIRETPADRLEQLICHMSESHEWEGKSEI